MDVWKNSTLLETGRKGKRDHVLFSRLLQKWIVDIMVAYSSKSDGLSLIVIKQCANLLEYYMLSYIRCYGTS